MARLPRLTVAGHVHHIIQRGNNSQPIFLAEGDHARLLTLLDEHARTLHVAVHAYVLMPNHFHLLVTPETADGVPQLMQALGRRYVRYFNQRHARTGTLWDGRYKSTLIQAERYLLACMIYLDLNPVRSGIADDAGSYAWSSHAHYAGQTVNRLLTPHAAYWSLGNTPFAREAAYLDLLRLGLGVDLQRALTDSALHGWALGGVAYVETLQKLVARRITKGRAGRPASGRS